MWKSLVFICFVPFISQTQAARRIDAEDRVRRSLINAPTPEKRTFGEKISSIEKLLHLSKNEKLVEQTKEKTSKGHEKVRLYESHKGVRIYDTVITADLDDPKDVSGSYIEDIENDIPSITPEILENQALNIAVKDAGFDPDNDEIYNTKIELVILLKGKTARLCFFLNFMVNGDVTPSRLFYFIDAMNGEVVDSWQGLDTADVTGNGGNTKTGIVTFGQNNISPLTLTVQDGVCVYEDNEILVVNLQQGTDRTITTPYSVECPNDDVGSPDTINGGASAANDAFYFGKATKEMYRNWYGIDVLNEKLHLKVHLGQNYANTFWDGTDSVFIGDGGSDHYPLVSVDITAHEISHGFTEHNSGLEYRNQSGGINEAFSDMAGEAVEYFVTGSNDWKVGFDIVKDSNGALRYMTDPNLDGNSISDASDYQTSMDVHYSSGVYNKAFYNLAMTPGWGVKIAFHAFLKANFMYWSPTTNFVQGACGVLKAAADLDYSTDDVINAFQTVGIVPETSCTYQTDYAETLTPFVGIPQLSAMTGGKLYFDISVYPGMQYAVFLAEGNGDFNMYVKQSTKPTTESYDYLSTNNGNTETVAIGSPAQGHYYIMLHAVTTFSDVTLTAYIY